eukprot:jgi/Galph1/5971/GphlegSOOS_G4556.1
MDKFEETCCILASKSTSPKQSILEKLKKEGVVHWEAACSLWFLSILSTDCKKNGTLLGEDLDAEAMQEKISVAVADGRKSNYFMDDCLKESLEFECLETLGLLSSATQWTRKAIRTNTRLFYTQEKFNLLREESEGFAKLVTDLFRVSYKRSYIVNLPSYIVSLIGCFDLDPNRVADLLWNICAFSVNKFEVFKPGFPLFRSDYISHILGFKFQNCNSSKYHGTFEAENVSSLDVLFAPLSVENSMLPCSELVSLVQVTAEALTHQVILLYHIWSYLTPETSVCQSMILEYLEQMEKATGNVGIVSLSKVEESNESRPNRLEQSSNVFEDIDNGPFANSFLPKIEVICALLQRGDWNAVTESLNLLSLDMNGRDLTIHLCSHPPFRSALIGFVEQSLENFFGKKLQLSMSNHHGQDNSREKQRQPLSNLLYFSSLSDLVLYTDGNSHVNARRKYHLLVYLLFYLGPNAKQSCRLLFLLSRLVQSLMLEERFHRNLGVKLLLEVLFPSMSCVKGNPALAVEVWRTLSRFSFDERYQIYDLLKLRISSEYNHIKRANAWTSYETKRILRRLAKENVKQFGRWLGKIANGNPLVAAECILDQVQSYENIIPVLIDALKYMSRLTLDVILYSCMKQLDTCKKDKIKADGMNLAQWYYGLCLFISGFIRKYCTTIDCRGIFYFIFNKLEEGDANYVFLLHSTEHLNDSQLETLAGGPLLREIIATTSTSVSDSKRGYKKAAENIREILISTGLAADLAIIVAQQKRTILFDPMLREIPLRMICNLFDKCQETLIQYTDLLFGNCSSLLSKHQMHVEEQSSCMDNNVENMVIFPSLESLVVDYHLSYDAAFLFVRPFLHDEEALDPLREPRNNLFHMEMFKRVVPSVIWKSMTPQLFIIFWTLKLHDIYVPKSSYNAELQRLRSILQSNPWNEADNRSTISHDSKDDRRTKQEGRKAEEMIRALEGEMQKHEEHHNNLLDSLRSRKDELFSNIEIPKQVPLTFLQTCIIPRCIASAADASFCSRFFQLLLFLDPPGFRILPYFHYLLINMAQVALCLTETEASRFGAFLSETLKMLNEWLTDESKYTLECSTKRIFSLQVDADENSGLPYSDFVTWNHKVHNMITKNILANLNTSNYLYLRNSLEILSRIVKYFPHLETHGNQIRRKIQDIVENDSENLRVMASRYLSLLQSQKENWVNEPEISSSITLQTTLTNPKSIFTTNENGDAAYPEDSPTDSKMEIDTKLEQDKKALTTLDDENYKELDKDVDSTESQEHSRSSPQSKDVSTQLEDRQESQRHVIAETTQAELARIQAAVAEKRQLLQQERERRSRMVDKHNKEDSSSKKSPKETPEPGEIVKVEHRQKDAYKSERRNSNRNDSEDTQLRKRRREIATEETDSTKPSTEEIRRNKRERAESTELVRNDSNVSHSKESGFGSDRLYSPTRRNFYNNSASDTNRNRTKATHNSQERSRETQTTNTKSKSISLAATQRRGDENVERGDYAVDSGNRSSTRSRKLRR